MSRVLANLLLYVYFFANEISVVVIILEGGSEKQRLAEATSRPLSLWAQNSCTFPNFKSKLNYEKRLVLQLHSTRNGISRCHVKVPPLSGTEAGRP